jgi:hypothetical protein
MEVTKCKNGYLIESGQSRYIATDIQELFARMLNLFESKSEVNVDSNYGKVTVTYDNDYDD